MRQPRSVVRAIGDWVGKGIGIHWPDIDEDLSVLGMLVGSASHAA